MNQQRTKEIEPTMERTIIGKTGKGLLSVSSDGAKALGIGGLSRAAGEPSSSSTILLQGESRLGLGSLPLKESL